MAKSEKNINFHKYTHKELFGKSDPEERKPTINELRKECGLSGIPDGDIALTKV